MARLTKIGIGVGVAAVLVVLGLGVAGIYFPSLTLLETRMDGAEKTLTTHTTDIANNAYDISSNYEEIVAEWGRRARADSTIAANLRNERAVAVEQLDHAIAKGDSATAAYARGKRIIMQRMAREEIAARKSGDAAIVELLVAMYSGQTGADDSTAVVAVKSFMAAVDDSLGEVTREAFVAALAQPAGMTNANLEQRVDQLQGRLRDVEHDVDDLKRAFDAHKALKYKAAHPG